MHLYFYFLSLLFEFGIYGMGSMFFVCVFSFFFVLFDVFFRIMVAIMTGIGILWIPVVQSVQGGQLFLYIQAVSAYFSPPIAALYLIAILWTKATEKVNENAKGRTVEPRFRQLL